MDIYSREPTEQPPRVLPLEIDVARFDAQPIEAFPIQHTLTLAAPMYRVEAVWQGGAALAGYDLTPSPPVAGQPITLVLAWQAEEPIAEGYQLVVELHNEQGTSVATGVPLCGSVSPVVWHTTPVVHTAFAITVPSAPGTECSTLVVGLRHTDSGAWLPLQDGSKWLPLTTLPSDLENCGWKGE